MTSVSAGGDLIVVTLALTKVSIGPEKSGVIVAVEEVDGSDDCFPQDASKKAEDAEIATVNAPLAMLVIFSNDIFIF